jgi:hypothetical protein
VRDDGTYEPSETELILDSALIPAPLGNYDEGFDRYDNSIVYFFSFFGCFLLVFGLAAVAIAAYRVAKHRPHATRGLVVAIIATLIGVAVTTAAISQL